MFEKQILKYGVGNYLRASESWKCGQGWEHPHAGIKQLSIDACSDIYRLFLLGNILCL
jgi:hypothetical protein